MPETTLIELNPTQPIPEFLRGEVQSKLAYADEKILRARVSEEGKVILEVLLPLDMAERQALEEKALRVAAALARGARPPRVEVLEDFMHRPVQFHQDPMPELLARGEVSPERAGVYALGPLLARLMDKLEAEFTALAESFGAQPYRFPTLIPAKYLARVNYFRAFPHSLSFATHLRSDLDVIEDFSQHACCEGETLSVPMGSFTPFETLLSPAVCYHLYFALADSPLPGGKLAATAVSNCFRYESSNLTTLERLWNFTMREIIFIGTPEYVLENRETARLRMQERMAEWGLRYRVESANDPFFIGEFKRQAIFQSAFQLKFEIRADLPFKGSTLAVGSYNYHQDFFGRSLNITLPDGSPVHTGCVAFGLERMAYAILAQFGLDPANFPEALR